MLFYLWIEILGVNRRTGLRHRLNLPYELIEIVHAEAYLATLINSFGSLQCIGTFGVRRGKRKNLFEFE